MNLFLKSIVISFLAVVSASADAQGLNSAYFTDDYKYRHDLNPAYGNEQNYISIPALGSINVRTMGNFGYEDVLRKNPLYPDDSDKKMTTFMNPYLSDPLDGFSKRNNKIGAEADIALLSAGFRAFGGYNTIEVNSRTQAHGKIPYELFSMAADTKNKEYDIDNINFSGQSFVEVALGHSHRIGDKLRVGAKVKFLMGLVDADLDMRNVKAVLEGSEWSIHADASSHVSMKGFKYKSEERGYLTSDGTYERINGIDADGFGVGGFGVAADLGVVYDIDDNWQISASLMDLGFISWDNDMYAVNREKEFVFSGFHDTSIKMVYGETIDDQIDSYDDQLSKFYNLHDEGDKGSRTTGIGARMNVGVSYVIPESEQFKIGLVSATRFLGKHTWTEARLSGNWMPADWLDGNVNVAVGSYTASVGWLINIHPKAVNFFVGMDHIVGKLSKEYIPLSSNANLALGFNVAW